MADITIAQLSAELPSNCIVLNGGSATLDLNLLSGESSIVSGTGISESIHKLLTGCEKAQATYNLNKASSQPTIDAFPELFASTPSLVDDVLISQITHTVNVVAPINTDNITALTK